MKNPVLFLFALLTFCITYAQKAAPGIQRIDPVNWWIGMKNPSLQLLVYGPDAGKFSYSINYPGIRLLKTHTTENPNYAFLDLTITPVARAGMLKVVGKSGNQTISRNYELKPRTREVKGSGVGPGDLIYLIMPDRFANGDAS